MNENITSGFYKNDEGTVLYAPNFVINKTFELYKEQHTTYSYPIEGWSWFDTEDEAYQFFSIQKKE